MRIDSKYLKKLHIISYGAIGCVIIFFLMTHFSPKALYVLAGNVSTDSFLYDYSMKRIVVSYDKNPETVLDIVLEKYDAHDPYFYVDTVLLSVFGGDVSIDALKKKIDTINKIESDIYVDSNASLLIESIGISMMEDQEDFLADLLTNLNNNSDIGHAINFIVARTLFMLTGKTHIYTSGNHSKSTVHLTDEIIEVRNTLVKSKGRKRSVQEMILLLDAI